MYSHLFCSGGGPLSGKLSLLRWVARSGDQEKAGPGEQRARERGLGAGKDQGEILAANTRGFPRASAGPARESGDSSPSQGRIVKRAVTRPSLARDARTARPRRTTRSVCAGGLAEARELPTPGREVVRLHSRSGRASAPACKRPAEAGRSRKSGKTVERQSPSLAPPTIAPPEGIEPSLPRLRSLGPASTGRGYHRMRGAPDASHEIRTPGAHSVNSSRRNTHTFTPCRTAVRIALTVTEVGASASATSRKGSE